MDWFFNQCNETDIADKNKHILLSSVNEKKTIILTIIGNYYKFYIICFNTVIYTHFNL